MVYPRKPLPVDAQITALRKLHRQSATAVKHAYNAFFECTRKRSDCPFEVQLRSRRIDEARKSLAYVVACLQELLRQKAMQEALYKPGDRIEVTYGATLVKQYLIVDIAPKAKGKGFYYVIWELTKRGVLHQGRDPHRLDSTRRVVIELLVDSPNAEPSSDAQWYREAAIASTERSLAKGDLTMFKERKLDLFGEVVIER